MAIVYFAYENITPYTGVVKVGMTRKTFKERNRGFKAGNFRDLKTIATITVDNEFDAKYIERRIHDDLKSRQMHVNREWFKMSLSYAVMLKIVYQTYYDNGKITTTRSTNCLFDQNERLDQCVSICVRKPVHDDQPKIIIDLTRDDQPKIIIDLTRDDE